MENVLDAKAVAKLLGVTVSAVHRLAARGTLPASFLGGVRIWTRENVNRYLADEAAQKRRRSGALISQGQLELTVDAVIEAGKSRRADRS